MNKIKYFLFIMLFSFIIPNVFAKETINIKSIVLDSKSETTTINSEPTFSGLEMNYDISFEEVGDFAKYKIVIENNTNKTYKVSEEKSFKLSEFVTYSYESGQELKPNTTSEIYVIIKYSYKIEDSLFVEGKYVETNNAILQMTDENNVTIVNPNTGVVSTLLIIIFTMILAVCIVIMINKKKPVIMIILLCIYLIPIITYATETLKLTINVQTKINDPTPHRVLYVLVRDALIKSDEVGKYDLSHSKCSTLYKGSVAPENEYVYCNQKVIVPDEHSYKQGETVSILDITYDRINSHMVESDFLDENGTVKNKGKIQEYYAFSWIYSGSQNNHYEIPTFENDKEIMNFTSITEDKWEGNREIDVTTPGTFTMPYHDVMLTEKTIVE